MKTIDLKKYYSDPELYGENHLVDVTDEVADVMMPTRRNTTACAAAIPAVRRMYRPRTRWRASVTGPCSNDSGALTGNKKHRAGVRSQRQ